MHGNYNIIENKFQSNIIVFKQPLGKNNPIKSYVQSGLVININSKHKNEAFDFVQFMLSKSVQSDAIKTIDLPVNKESYKKNEIKSFDDGFKGIISGYLDINESRCLRK